MKKQPITGAILAGGKASRMNGCDKGLVKLSNIPLYQHLLNKLKHQVDSIIINANRNHEVYKQSGYPVISDSIDGFQGPLAGMLSVLEFVLTEWVVFVPCDTPFIPDNLVEYLWNNRNNKKIAYVREDDKAHPTLCLMHKSLAYPIKNYLNNGDRKLILFFQQNDAQAVTFSSKNNNFININTLDECKAIDISMDKNHA